MRFGDFIDIALGLGALVACIWHGYQGNAALSIAWLGVSVAYRAHDRLNSKERGE